MAESFRVLDLYGLLALSRNGQEIGILVWGKVSSLRWIPQALSVSARANKDYVRVLSYSYYSTIAGWGVNLIRSSHSYFQDPRDTTRGLSQHGGGLGTEEEF